MSIENINKTDLLESVSVIFNQSALMYASPPVVIYGDATPFTVETFRFIFDQNVAKHDYMIKMSHARVLEGNTLGDEKPLFWPKLHFSECGLFPV